ncbi:hypothetical protein [Caulifigura coniformis]|nr:hypothetical protein [Caulifigura coniformis]
MNDLSGNHVDRRRPDTAASVALAFHGRLLVDAVQATDRQI